MPRSLFAILLLVLLEPMLVAGPVLDSMDELRFRAPKEKGKAELVEGKIGKAVRFHFDKDARSVFFTIEGNEEYRKLLEELQVVLAAVLPPTLGFKKVIIRSPDVLLSTRSGDFSLDAVSGGIAAIIDTAWQIFLQPPGDGPLVVTMDEPENHLHPEMQRTVLPNLLKAFPTVQFIVASHNPFIVSSVRDSSVYVLDYDATNRVQSKPLDTANRAGTANEILRDVLGLQFTMALWVEDRLSSVVADFEKEELTQPALDKLRLRLKEFGLEKCLPDTLARVLQGPEGQ